MENTATILQREYTLSKKESAIFWKRLPGSRDVEAFVEENFNSVHIAGHILVVEVSVQGEPGQDVILQFISDITGLRYVDGLNSIKYCAQIVTDFLLDYEGED